MSKQKIRRRVILPGAGMSRRRFLAQSSLAALSGLALPRLVLADCEATTPDILGPYHVDDAPWRTVIASADEPGTRLFISGRVFARDCVSPASGVIVDVWHATDAGCYSVLEECPDEDPFNCRGQMLTDGAGRYAFETVLPGWYLAGSNYRPRHIHFIIAPADGDSLTTQLYFEGDPYIPDDPWASDPAAAARIIPLVPDGDALRGEFDINLDVDASTAADEDHLLPTALALHQNYPNPFNPHTVIRYQLRLGAFVSLEVFTPGGRVLRRLVHERQEPGFYTARWDGRDELGQDAASGIYLYRLVAGPVNEVRKMHLIR